jgi:hypothetical protein
VFSAVPFFYTRQFDEASRRLRRAVGSDQRNLVAPAYAALLEALEGNFQKAEDLIAPPDEVAEKLLGAHHAFYARACVYALHGKSAEAVRWLGKTVETGMPNYPMFRRDPNLSLIRNSKEFRSFMDELKPRWEAMEREFR